MRERERERERGGGGGEGGSKGGRERKRDSDRETDKQTDKQKDSRFYQDIKKNFKNEKLFSSSFFKYLFCHFEWLHILCQNELHDNNECRMLTASSEKKLPILSNSIAKGSNCSSCAAIFSSLSFL